MSLLSEKQNISVPQSLEVVLQHSSELRLPKRFKKLRASYIEKEFTEAKQPDLFDSTLVIKMPDEGMCPTIAANAMLVVDGGLKPKHNDIVVAEYYGSTICRRIFVSKQKSWLYGDDRDAKFIDLSKAGEVAIVGVVTSHYMNHNVA
ncbi:MAG: S24 family peptidase [Hyphomicrobiales bacterium]